MIDSHNDAIQAAEPFKAPRSKGGEETRK
jgi:hypothetical protein